MSKKHFQAIAQILNNHGADPNLIEGLGYYFQNVNPNFDMEKFLEAALFTQEEVRYDWSPAEQRWIAR